jgi:hypothetical protein
MTGYAAGDNMNFDQRIEKLKNGSDTAIWAANEIERLRETLDGIANADWRTWEELASPDEFVRWAKSRAQHALTHNAELRRKPPYEL